EETRLDPDQNDFVNTIRHSSETLLKILNDILDISVVEAGKLELSRKRFHVGECIEDVAELMMPLARQKGLRLHLRIAPEARLRRVGDPHRLRQVLLNLVGNAIKFTDSGRVIIEIR